MKNGTISIKPKPLFPGCVFLRCVLNKELHDFIREVDGVGGFVGSKVGNTYVQLLALFSRFCMENELLGRVGELVTCELKSEK